ncbi:MAG TPA: glycosyltransferase, partial [Candidatus Sumerlaeota bacterium]|nr:glycosyltransferase [Candidatus Sumerlaeota bacterium]
MTYLRFGIHLLLILALNYWILSFFFYRKLKRAVPHLEKLELPLPPKPPLVSVIMPACNEADHLELAVLSRLKSDYPNAEFILVDDRST